MLKFPARRPQNSHVLVLWRPNIWIRRAEEENTIRADGRSQMRNSTVVPDEYRALKDGGETRQRQVPGETDAAILPFALQFVGLSFVRLAGNHQQAFKVCETTVWRKQANPVFQWPVLFVAAASRMYRDSRLRHRREESASKLLIV